MLIPDIFSCDIGVDLGTVNTLIYRSGRGIILREPSVVALDDKRQVIACGNEALTLVGRSPKAILTQRPLRDGVISDIDVTIAMLKHFLSKALEVRRPLYMRIVICVPCCISQIERRAVEDAAHSVGAKEVRLIEEPLAAAIGAGLPVNEPRGSMIVDIGGGSTDSAVVAMGGIVVSDSIRCGGNHMDEAIIHFARRRAGIIIGERTAEHLKLELATAMEAKNKSIAVRGRDLRTGLPVTVGFSSEQISSAIMDCVQRIVSSVMYTLESVPPELAGDLLETGIMLTGGGGRLDSLDVLLHNLTGLSVCVSHDALDCVAIGAGKVLSGNLGIGLDGSFKRSASL